MPLADRLRLLVPGLWAGLLLCVALIATPAAFAKLAQADAGRVAGRILAQEAYSSLVLGADLVLILERLSARRAATEGQGSQFSTEMMLAGGALFCTVLGYFGIQPLLPDARAGVGPLSFGQLHLVSTVFFAIKLGLVLALVWRAAGVSRRPSSSR